MPTYLPATIFAAVLLGACAHAPEPISAPVPPPAVVVPEAAALSELPASPPPAPPRADRLTLTGVVTLPRSVVGLANARDGVVVGTPVAVLDALSGARLGQGSTFYDGSYVAQVPTSVGRRPAILMVQLVDAVTHKPVCPLYAPLMLAPAQQEQTQDVGTGSTAFLALLYTLAARKAEQPVPDWTALMPGVTSRTLAEMILGTQPNAQWTFTLFAESDGTLGKATSASQLRAGIDALVTKLVATAHPASAE
ncbi:MAG: hypothetical protein JWM80_3510 [Cyanobacteria bacterium RYN_339]|nr:hypothetical protein [Cyanobacteria bacterium RYN_339]